jgi:hypothetical protein
MRCPACHTQNYPTDKTCRKCNCVLALTDADREITRAAMLQAKVAGNSQTSVPVDDQIVAGTATSRTSDEDEAQRIRLVFKWLFVAWLIFFTLAWSISNFKPAIELFVSALIAAAAALVSTLIYWGIREFLKPSDESVRRADAAESEIAELRRQVEELSRKSED